MRRMCGFTQVAVGTCDLPVVYTCDDDDDDGNVLDGRAGEDDGRRGTQLH